MKIELNIPNEFINDIKNKTIIDSLKRIKFDITHSVHNDIRLSGNWEVEIIDMLCNSFNKTIELKNDSLNNNQKFNFSKESKI